MHFDPFQFFRHPLRQSLEITSSVLLVTDLVRRMSQCRISNCRLQQCSHRLCTPESRITGHHRHRGPYPIDDFGNLRLPVVEIFIFSAVLIRFADAGPAVLMSFADPVEVIDRTQYHRRWRWRCWWRRPFLALD